MNSLIKSIPILKITMPAAWLEALYRVGLLSMVLLLSACSGQPEKASLPVLTGHFEGPVTYQGTDLRVVLDIRETTPGQLQADMHFPEIPGISFPVANLRYQEPQLHFEQQPGQPGSITVNAVREGDFLRGIFTWDTIQTQFVWVRRGQAAARPYREQSVRLPGLAATSMASLLIPQDTAQRYPAVVLLPDQATAGAAATRADLLARHGFAVLLLPAVATDSATAADSLAYHTASAGLAACRTESSIDTARVGLWVRGANAALATRAALQAQPNCRFTVLEGVPVQTRAQAQPYQLLGRKMPVLGIYGAADTTLNVQGSVRYLRPALRGRASTVRLYPKANRNLTVVGYTTAQGQWQWPQPAPNFVNDLLTWLRQQTVQ
ncbi:hypothetical protein MUN82_20580 [Hymenobacter aerilatus]|uniref:Dienelactone hydrolase domain-containing protein n=1 Tax=Hymenobacter aerilatus TaxID=2932251 RepID=A0A8T9STZ2_9BACT|nr:hypothetical protein [Hymenobacter aerilatus]UOR05315.1 hypothetical protein MUN82_20580 [Hymenobacter aerilatus]